MRLAWLIFGALLASTSVAAAQGAGCTPLSACPPISTSTMYLNGAIVGPTGVPLIPPNSLPAAGQVMTATDSAGHTAWATGGTGSVTQTTVVPANGFSGSVANATTTPAITLSTTITGLLKGNGTALLPATAGTDYLAPNGSAAGLTGLPLSTGVTGNLPVINLNGGTNASALTVWCGNGTWCTPSGGGTGNTYTAAGTSCPAATPLTTSTAVITSGTVGQGVAPISTVGMVTQITNTTAVAINVCPPSGASFPGLSAGAPMSLAANGGGTFSCATSTICVLN